MALLLSGFSHIGDPLIVAWRPPDTSDPMYWGQTIHCVKASKLHYKHSELFFLGQYGRVAPQFWPREKHSSLCMTPVSSDAQHSTPCRTFSSRHL